MRVLASRVTGRAGLDITAFATSIHIDDGIATVKTLFLDAPIGIITAVGELDLGRSQLDLRVTPRPVDPGLLSVAVTVDVTGPIGAPVLTPVHRPLATSAVQELISDAMRPARCLLSSFQRGTSDQKNLCAGGDAERSSD